MSKESTIRYFLIFPMLRALFSAVLVAIFAFMHVSGASAASIAGEHPYNQPSRIVRGSSGERNTGTWGYRAIRDFELSPYRTTSHYLHPYFRKQPNQMFLAEEYRRIHPYIYQHKYEQYQLGGYAF